MNLSRFAIAFLTLVPTILFIAAAATAPDPAPTNAAQNRKPASPPDEPSPPAAAASGTSGQSAPLRTQMQSFPLPGSERSDAATTSAILSAIRGDPGMSGADISVNTENGVVTLTGIVRNREQSAIASAYADRQLGVVRVDNTLAIPAQ